MRQPGVPPTSCSIVCEGRLSGQLVMARAKPNCTEQPETCNFTTQHNKYFDRSGCVIAPERSAQQRMQCSCTNQRYFGSSITCMTSLCRQCPRPSPHSLLTLEDCEGRSPQQLYSKAAQPLILPLPFATPDSGAGAAGVSLACFLCVGLTTPFGCI